MKLVAAAIAINDGLVLLARRAAGQSQAGYWEFPGGKLEPGETVQDCIVRELIEELGVHCHAREVLAESIYEYPGGVIKLIAVEVLLRSHDFRLSVHDAIRWVAPNALLDMNLAPADIPIAAELFRPSAEIPYAG